MSLITSSSSSYAYLIQMLATIRAIITLLAAALNSPALDLPNQVLKFFNHDIRRLQVLSYHRLSPGVCTAAADI